MSSDTAKFKIIYWDRLDDEKKQLVIIHFEKNKLFLPKTVKLHIKNGYWLPKILMTNRRIIR